MGEYCLVQDLDYTQSLPGNLTSRSIFQSSELLNLDPGLNKFTLDLYLPETIQQQITRCKNNQKDHSILSYHPPAQVLAPEKNSETGFMQYITEHWPEASNDKNSNISSHGSTPVPLVVFVHGGGWRRGHKEGWRHYASVYDINLLIAGLLKFFGIFGNVGEVFAQQGIACAVVSYPLVRLGFPWLLLEMCSSLFMSWLLCAPGMIILLVLIYLVCINQCGAGFGNLLQQVCWPYTTLALLVLAMSQLASWLVLVRSRHAGHCPPLIQCNTSTILGFLWTTVILLLPLDAVSPEILIWFVSAVTTCLVQGISAYTFCSTVKTADSYEDQAASVATSVGWLSELGEKTGLFNPHWMFLMGHSAGAHLVSLVTLDSKYLNGAGCSMEVVKGVIGISGVYDVKWLKRSFLQHLYLNPVFGSDPKGWKAASPLYCLPPPIPRGNEMEKESLLCSFPPFLLFSAEWDLALNEQAQTFVDRLNQYPASVVQYQVVPGTDHFTIMAHFGRKLKLQESGLTMEDLCISFISNIVQQHISKSQGLPYKAL